MPEELAQLPIHVDIKADESTYGWLIRLSHINCLRIANLFNVGCTYKFGTYKKWKHFKYKGHITKKLWDAHSANRQLKFNSIVQAKPAFVIRDYEFNFCPLCLAEDKTPYIRMHWHAKWLSHCHIHNVKMLSSCSYCGGALSYFWKDQWISCDSCGMLLAESLTTNYPKCDQVSQTTFDFIFDLFQGRLQEYESQRIIDFALFIYYRLLPHDGSYAHAYYELLGHTEFRSLIRNDDLTLQELALYISCISWNKLQPLIEGLYMKGLIPFLVPAPNPYQWVSSTIANRYIKSGFLKANIELAAPIILAACNLSNLDESELTLLQQASIEFRRPEHIPNRYSFGLYR